MRNALFVFISIVVFTWLEFAVFPGHTYLQSDTQIYLPILERLDSPGFLSRDLIATHPHVSYTIYDEVTLFLHSAAQVSFERALVGQQLLFRAAGLLGVYLLVQTTGLPSYLCFLVATLVNLGGALLGPAVLVVEYEPVPRGFAFGLILLALGLMAHEKPLLAGLAGSLAFLYHPPTSAPFWGFVIGCFLFSRNLRPYAKPALTVLFIATLLLANLSQLQPGVVEPQPLFTRISDQLAALQHYRTRYAWVSLWAGRDIWQYLALATVSYWAFYRVWASLNVFVRLFAAFFPIAGLVSIAASDLLLEHMRLSALPQMQPARALLFTVLFASLGTAIAGCRAALSDQLAEATGWFAVAFVIPMRIRLLDLLDLWQEQARRQLLLAIVLAWTLAFVISQARTVTSQVSPGRLRRTIAQRLPALACLAIPVAAMMLMPTFAAVENYKRTDNRTIVDVADWAANNTWGSSMFLFPDAGRDLYPGVFRAQSRRALWVDWKSGGQVNYFESLATEWFSRWQQTVNGPYSAQRLQSMLQLPIDYYVVKSSHRLQHIPTVYANTDFAVYDAKDLQRASESGIQLR